MEFLRRKKPTLSIELSPLVDVVFLLLIFFMLSSTFLAPSLKLHLPKASHVTNNQSEQVVISIDQEGNVFLNQQQTRMENLKYEIKNVLKDKTKKSVHIRGDENMPYKWFVSAMDQAKQAGATQVNIVHHQN